RWAMRAEAVAPSPLGILIHPDYGLWHAYRGALAFAERLALPPRGARPLPPGLFARGGLRGAARLRAYRCRGRRGLHERRLPRPPRLPGRPGPRLWPGPGPVSHDGVPGRPAPWLTRKSRSVYLSSCIVNIDGDKACGQMGSDESSGRPAMSGTILFVTHSEWREARVAPMLEARGYAIEGRWPGGGGGRAPRQ